MLTDLGDWYLVSNAMRRAYDSYADAWKALASVSNTKLLESPRILAYRPSISSVDRSQLDPAEAVLKTVELHFKVDRDGRIDERDLAHHRCAREHREEFRRVDETFALRAAHREWRCRPHGRRGLHRKSADQSDVAGYGDAIWEGGGEGAGDPTPEEPKEAEKAPESSPPPPSR